MSFGTSIYFLASVELGPKRSSSYIFLVPITAMIFSMLFLKEPFQFTTIIGGVLGMLSIYIINN